MPEELIQYLPIFIPVAIVLVVVAPLLILKKKSYNYMELINTFDLRISEFKNRNFLSYEEESRARKQLREELLLEIKNKVPPMYRKMFEYRVDSL